MRTAIRLSLHHLLAAAMIALWPLVALSGTTNPHARFAGTYQSDLPGADTDKPVPSISASLGTDGTATIMQDPNGKGVTAQTFFGHWDETGGQVTVHFDAADGKPAPPQMVFQSSHDGLQAVTWDHAMWGKVTPPLMKKDNGNWHGGHHHIF
jgi:hypothetical protein